jgi:hypothetical protein
MTIQLGDYELPEHISYSAFTTYVDCGYQYYLGRLMQLPEEQSVWSVGGANPDWKLWKTPQGVTSNRVSDAT